MAAIETGSVMICLESIKLNAQQCTVSVCLFNAQVSGSFSLQGGFRQTEKKVKQTIKLTEISQSTNTHIMKGAPSDIPQGWGDSRMEWTGMLVGNFEFNP